MRFSQIFGHTLKEAPSDTQAVSHQYLVRGGYIHQVAAGLFSYLPLARRVLNKIEGILHDEMGKIGGPGDNNAGCTSCGHVAGIRTMVPDRFGNDPA